MEAQLLQVTLPEIQELYQTLLSKLSPAQQMGRSSPGRPGSEKVSMVGRLWGRGGAAWWTRVPLIWKGQVSAGSRCAVTPGLPTWGLVLHRVSGLFSFHERCFYHFRVKVLEAGYFSPVRDTQ